MCRRGLKCSMIRRKAMFPVVVLQGRCTKKHDTRVELLFWLLNPLLLRRPCCLCLPGCLKLPIQCLGARQVGYIFLQLRPCSNGPSMLWQLHLTLFDTLSEWCWPTMIDPLHHLVAWCWMLLNNGWNVQHHPTLIFCGYSCFTLS